MGLELVCSSRSSAAVLKISSAEYVKPLVRVASNFLQRFHIKHTFILMASQELLDAAPKEYFALVKKDIAGYNQWAHTYDSHLEELNYKGPLNVVEKWQSYHTYTDLATSSKKLGKKHKIFDAGCGTGLVGELLAKSPANESIEVYGGDLTSKMLDVARSKAVYTDLQIVNLKEQLPYEANSFDSVLAAGVFGAGHCGSECVPNVVRILSPGCYFILTVNKDIFGATEATEWRKQIEENGCELVEKIEAPFFDLAQAFVLVIRKATGT